MDEKKEVTMIKVDEPIKTGFLLAIGFAGAGLIISLVLGFVMLFISIIGLMM